MDIRTPHADPIREPVIPTSWWRSAFLLGFVAVLLVTLHFARPAIAPVAELFATAVTILVFAAVLTYLLQPPVQWLARVSRMKNQHAASGLAVLVIYLVLGAVLYVFGAGLVSAIRANVQELVETGQVVVRVAQDPKVVLPANAPQQLVNVQKWYIQLPDDVRTRVSAVVGEQVQSLGANTGLVAMSLGVARKAGAWLGQLVEFVFVPLLAFYFLTDAGRVREQMLSFFPPLRRTRVLRYASGANEIMRRYIYGQFILCLIAWVVVTLALALLGVKGFLLLGLIAGISRAIPVLGPVVGGIPVLGAVFFSDQCSWAFWGVLVGFTALHLFESKYLMPRILGDSIDIHPVLVIVSLLIGYELMGLAGMFFAPPLVAVIRFLIADARGEYLSGRLGLTTDPDMSDGVHNPG